MKKMVMISYNEAIESDVIDSLEACCLKNYTKLTNVFGKGTSSGTHLGNDIWPGQNSLLLVACDEEHAHCLTAAIRELRKRLGSEGVKAFVMPMEEIT